MIPAVDPMRIRTHPRQANRLRPALPKTTTRAHRRHTTIRTTKTTRRNSAQGSSGQGLSADADLAEDSPAISAEDAIKKAKDKVGGGTVHGIELDWDDKDQAWQYDVSILDGKTDHDVDIDAETGKVVSEDKDDADDKEQAIDLNDPMTFEDALKRAQKKSDGKLVSWKLEFDDDKQEYQFDFEKDGEDTEVTVGTESKRVSVDD